MQIRIHPYQLVLLEMSRRHFWRPVRSTAVSSVPEWGPNLSLTTPQFIHKSTETLSLRTKSANRAVFISECGSAAQ
jgi:hypothetical protein